MRKPLKVSSALLTLVILATSCADGNSVSNAPVETSAPTTTAEAAVTIAALPLATFTTRPGMNQLAVLGAVAGETLEIVAADDTVTASGVVDDQGSFLQRNLAAGTYVVRTTIANPTASAPVDVFDESQVPAHSFYENQVLPAGGFGYITTRDGTTLSANVMLPGPVENGPYPTIVEYSGYDPSNPANNTFGLLFNALGYAYVGVNMRGSGCSGGSYLFFERAQTVDGYDVIEAVAAQDWVLNNKVGMGGISYPGIAQLFVASTTPPSLEAIAPLSVLDDSYRATGYPGGILNTGFATQFIQERAAEAKPYGQSWTKKRADEGDTVCAENQMLRLQNPDFLELTKDNAFYDPALADTLSPSTFVGKINVPVFLAGAWQDEQTGGHFPNMIPDFTGTPHLYVDLVNGLHTDSLSPAIFARMVEFYDLYVKRQTPSLAGARVVAAILVPGIFHTPSPALPPDRFAGMSYAAALATFEAEPSVRVLFENGASGLTVPSGPLPRWIEAFDTWPVPTAKSTSWFFNDNGVLSLTKPATGASDSYIADPSALPRAFYPGKRSSNIWGADVVYDWRLAAPGTSLAYATEPLAADTVVVGTGSVDLWIKSSTADTDLEVTITEVRPDGTEMYIQTGWLRATHRALDLAKSTDVRPVQTHAKSTAAPLPPNEFTPVRVQIFPFAYAFRKGSRIRITIDAPGDNRPVWEFDTISKGETVTIAHDAGHPSAVVLPVIPGLKVPAGYAKCGSLRGQPCRGLALASLL